MSIIKILSEHLINQIAAGEVIERPASCVKELVENSVDAGASEIIIEINDGGKTLIRVSDNGCGMSKEDSQKSFLRHATSKISNEYDLWNIRTFGFRGEALASIASVSQMVLKTKLKNENAGIEISCVAGEIKTISECGMRDGTSIEVHNLFFNTPARQKYLKKDVTELSQIISFLHAAALANINISFRFIHNGRLQFDLPKTDNMLRRISDIFGKSTADAMIPIFYGGSDFKIDGFIGKPVISRSDSRHQYIFVNGRPIQHKLVSFRIKDAFHSMLMGDKKPVFIINIKIDPSLIDVNVHPRKIEIRFEDEHRLLGVVYSATKAALESHNLTPKAFIETQRYMSDRFPDYIPSTPNITQNFAQTHTQDSIQKSFDLPMVKKFSMKAVTQVSNSYIVAENDEGLVLIDQHAAHERVRYFELLEQFNSNKKNIQPLLVPETLSLSLDESVLLSDSMEIFSGLGFEIEKGPGNELVLYSVPAVLSSEDIVDVINGVLYDLSNEKQSNNVKGRVETVMHFMACRSAIKFGKKLTIDEMDALLARMEEIEKPYTCPHGRPTMIKLTFNELEMMFGRK